MELIEKKDKTCLTLEGEMTVNNAAAFRDLLLQSLKKSSFVEIDFEEVTAVDLSCLQLICSAHRFAAEEGKDIVIKDNRVPVLLQARTTAGFNLQQSCGFDPSLCLWEGGTEK